MVIVDQLSLVWKIARDLILALFMFGVMLQFTMEVHAAAVTIADVAVSENAGIATVTLTLDDAVPGGFSVDVSTSDGTATTADSDYGVVVAQTVTFAGTAGETQIVSFTIIDNGVVEANETFTVEMSNLAATAFVVTIVDSAIVTINNDDSAPRIVSIERNNPTTETTEADSLIWRVTFDKAVTGIDAADFSVVGTTATITGVSAVSTSVYDVTVSGGDLANLEATVTLSALVVGSNNIEDTAGNDFANSIPTGINNNTFIIIQIPPTITIQGAPSTHDGSTSFNVTFEFSEPVTGFVIGDINVGNGAASNFVAVDANTYTADITPSALLDLTLDVPAAVAIDGESNDNTAATQVVVKGTIVSETQTIIADFMSNRAGHILNNQPDMIGFISGSNNGGGGPLGNLQLESNFDDQTTMSFYTSRSKIFAERNHENGRGARLTRDEPNPSFATIDRFGESDDQTLVGDVLASRQANATAEEQLAMQIYNGKDRTGSWDVWTQINGAVSSQADIKSEFWSANFGTHYFINNDTLIGMLTQFDWAEENNRSANSTVSGNGFLMGPYIAGKLKEHALFYEARALWGKSSNDITPIGTYTDNFETERWLASIKIQGSYDIDDHTKLKPEVSISYFEETQQAYTDTNANLIPEQTISLGEFKFGPTLTRSFDVGNGFTMHTTAGISGIANFGVNNANASTSNSFANENLRARVDAGFELENEYGVRFTAVGYYDGIGTSNYQGYGGTLGLIIPLR